MFLFAQKGDIKKIRECVSLGADINKRGSRGMTILIWAAKNCSLIPSFLSDLVELGADINAQDEHGRTALMWSAWSGSLTLELLDIFNRCRADVNARDKSGMTALIIATRHDSFNPEMLAAFLRSGANINTQDYDGISAFINSALHGNLTIELLDSFMAHDADINAQSQNGRTALMMSSYLGHIKHLLLEALVRHGADVDIADSDGNRAMALCVTSFSFSYKVQSLLAFLKCGYSIKNMYQGWTPENFIERLENNKDIISLRRAAYAMLAVISLYPERNETLDRYIAKKRSATINEVLPHLKDASPDIKNRFLRMLSEGRTSALSLSEESVEVLVGIMLETFDSDPDAVSEFIRKRVGKKLETWVKEGVEGADVLVSRLAYRMRHEELMSEGAGMPDLDLF